jgi:hypothetical protein
MNSLFVRIFTILSLFFIGVTGAARSEFSGAFASILAIVILDSEILGLRLLEVQRDYIKSLERVIMAHKSQCIDATDTDVDTGA